MLRRQAGFTLIEILVVITIIATLAGLVAATVPMILRENQKTTCMNNLSQIGKLLTVAKAKDKLAGYKGAAFLLQAKNELSDDQLKVFICPGEEPDNLSEPRPDAGSDEFIAMYRELDLNDPAAVREPLSSYAGPERASRSKLGAEAHATFLWGADRCLNGNPHHRGICILTDSGSTEFWEVEDIKGMSEDDSHILVGTGATDERLAKLRYYPDR